MHPICLDVVPDDTNPWKPEMAPQARVCVIGLGPIGALAQRISAARGAGPTWAVATSCARQEIAEKGGVIELLVTPEDDERIAQLEVETVTFAYDREQQTAARELIEEFRERAREIPNLRIF